jgi:hypothetical protein
VTLWLNVHAGPDRVGIFNTALHGRGSAVSEVFGVAQRARWCTPTATAPLVDIPVVAARRRERTLKRSPGGLYMKRKCRLGSQFMVFGPPGINLDTFDPAQHKIVIMASCTLGPQTSPTAQDLLF